MGTRSLTYVYDSTEFDAMAPLVCLYRQYDGYIQGHGKDVSEFLSSRKLVNGLGSDKEGVANGMGCLAALLISNLKGNEAGQFYLYAPIIGQDVGQEYEYHIFKDSVVVYDGSIRDGRKVFNGTWEEFSEICKVKE